MDSRAKGTANAQLRQDTLMAHCSQWACHCPVHVAKAVTPQGSLCRHSAPESLEGKPDLSVGCGGPRPMPVVQPMSPCSLPLSSHAAGPPLAECPSSLPHNPTAHRSSPGSPPASPPALMMHQGQLGVSTWGTRAKGVTLVNHR